MSLIQNMRATRAGISKDLSKLRLTMENQAIANYVKLLEYDELFLKYEKLKKENFELRQKLQRTN